MMHLIDIHTFYTGDLGTGPSGHAVTSRFRCELHRWQVSSLVEDLPTRQRSMTQCYSPRFGCTHMAPYSNTLNLSSSYRCSFHPTLCLSSKLLN